MQSEARTGVITRSIVGVFDSSEEAQRALEQLRAEGLGPEEVSVMMRDAHDAESLPEQATESPVAGGAATGAALGGLLGGLAGWMISIGAIAIPGVGLVLGAGALAATIAGIALGAATGGLIGGLLSLGVPEDDARQYESHVRAGHVLLTVHPSADFDIERATGIMAANGGYDVRVYDTPSERGADVDAPPMAESSQFAPVEHQQMEVQQIYVAPPQDANLSAGQPDNQETTAMVAPSEMVGSGTEVAAEGSQVLDDEGMITHEDIEPAVTEATIGASNDATVTPATSAPHRASPSIVEAEVPFTEVKTEEPPESVDEIRKHYQPE